jgi:hypothetical protein
MPDTFTPKRLSSRGFSSYATELGKVLPGALFIDEATTGISKMLDDRYWHRNLKKYAARWREHLHIAFGDVKRGAAPYCSKHHVDEWDARRKRSRAIMARLELEDQEPKSVFRLLSRSIRAFLTRHCAALNS